jgi:hypothetical protein
MYKSLAYKEWLKVRWFFIGALALELLVLFSLFINLRAILEFNAAKDIWSSIVLKNYIYFNQVKFIPLIIGFMIGVSQFYTELQDYKLKLTLHLPLKENNSLLFMVGFGFTLLVILFALLAIILILGSNIVFPAEIINAMLVTLVPWMLAGFTVYFVVANLFIEPLWVTRRMLLVVLGAEFISLLLLSKGYAAYKNILLQLTLITIVFGYVILLSGFRFKRGAK